MKKSIVSISAAALMVIGLAGCGANDNNFNTHNNGNVRVFDRGQDYNGNLRGLNQRDMNGNVDIIDDNEGPLTEIMDNDNDRNLRNNNNRIYNGTQNRFGTNPYDTNRGTLDFRGTTPDGTGITGTGRSGITGTGGTH